MDGTRRISVALVLLLTCGLLLGVPSPASATSIRVTPSEPTGSPFVVGCERYLSVTTAASFDQDARFAEVSLYVTSPTGGINSYMAQSGSLGRRATETFEIPAPVAGTYSVEAVWAAHNGNGLSRGIGISPAGSVTVPAKPMRARFDEVEKCSLGRAGVLIGGGGALIGIGAAVTAFLCPPCAVAALIIGVAGGVAGLAGTVTGLLALDPPDSNYTEIAVPQTPPLPQQAATPPVSQASADALNGLLATLGEELGLIRAVLTSIERAEGALAAGDESWEIQQMQAAGGFASDFADALRREVQQREAARATLAADGFDVQLTAQQLEDEREVWLTDGMPADLAEQLRAIGGDAAVESVRDAVGLVDPQASAGPFLDLISSPELNDGILALAQEMDDFAAEVAEDPLGTGPTEPTPEPEIPVPPAPSPVSLGVEPNGPRFVGCNDQQGLDCDRAIGTDGAAGVIVSPDGRHVYVAGRDNDAIAIFDRDAGTGELDQQLVPCVGNPVAVPQCAEVPAVDGVNGLEFAAEGSQLLATSRESDSLTVFDRNPETGALTVRACYTSRDDLPECASLPHLESANLLTLSPDETSVYVTSEQASVLTVLDRDTATGTLSETGCFVDVSVNAPGCIPQAGLYRAYAVSMSPDAQNVYVGSVGSAVVAFDRAGDGSLTPIGCASDGSTPEEAGCTQVDGLRFVQDVVVSADGAYVYASASETGSIIGFARAADGTLTQLPAPLGCVRDGDIESEVPCAGAAGLRQVLDLEFSPDGSTLYAVEYSFGTVTAFEPRADGTLEQIGPCVSGLVEGCENAPSLSYAGYLTVSPDGRHVYATSTSESSVTGMEILTPETALDPPPGPVERAAGGSRIDTAIEISQEVFEPDRVDTVVLARADVYADALSAAPIAGSHAAPLLLTGSANLDAATAEEIQRLGVDTIYLMGGESALAAQVDTDVRALGVSDVVRIAGANRFATAAAAAAEVGAGPVAYVVEGNNVDPNRGWPDAVAVSALAADQFAPILLVERDRLPEETAAALSAVATGTVTVVGGPAAVSEEVASQLAVGGATVERLAGATRFETSALIAARAIERGTPPTRTWLATGSNFPDSLAAGPAVAADGGILLLTASASLDDSPPIRDFLLANVAEIQSVRVIGGAAAISDAVENELRALFEAFDEGTLSPA